MRSRSGSSRGGRMIVDPSSLDAVAVDREAGAVVGDLEQHAAGLAEVDRVEVVAVDDPRSGDAGVAQTLLPARVLGDGGAPRDVVDRARALAAGLGRRLVVGDGRRRGPRRAAPTCRRPAPWRRGAARAGRRCTRVARCRRERRRSPAARARRGSRGARRPAGCRRPGARRARGRGPRGRRSAGASPTRSCATPSAPRRCAQKASASSEPTRETIRCTIPAPARPGMARGYSKKVSSAPGRPCSSA